MLDNSVLLQEDCVIRNLSKYT